MSTAYAILFIDKKTMKVMHAQFASAFPVAGLFSDAQVVLHQVADVDYDTARRKLRLLVKSFHFWAMPLFHPSEWGMP